MGLIAASADEDGVFGGVKDFFDSGVWLVVRNLTLFFVFVFWISTAFWVYKDARRRIEDPWLVVMATVLGLFPPFLGPIIYMFFRPPEYLDDVRERELEIRAMEERLARRDLFCPVCRAEVDAGFLVCPVCTTKLKQACANCSSPLEALWQICPYCETPVDTPTVVQADTWESPPRRTRRRPAASAERAERAE
jgi:Double zinc ribbon